MEDGRHTEETYVTLALPAKAILDQLAASRSSDLWANSVKISSHHADFPMGKHKPLLLYTIEVL